MVVYLAITKKVYFTTARNEMQVFDSVTFIESRKMSSVTGSRMSGTSKIPCFSFLCLDEEIHC